MAYADGFLVGSGGGGGGGGGTGVSEAEAIALIEGHYRVIDGTPANIPTAAASEKLKLAPDNTGVVRTLVEHIHYSVARAGTFSVYTHANYRGDFAFAPYPGTNTDDIYYDKSHEYFAKVRLVSPNNYQWRSTSIETALGADAVWLGHQTTQAVALAQIGTFDSSKTYYTYTSVDQNVMVLDNSTYVAGSGESKTQEWVSITGDTAERVARLEGYTPTYWAQTIDEPTYITGDDTETIESLNVDILDSYLDTGAMAYAQLVFDIRLEKATGLRIDSTIRIKHGTVTIHTESVPLQNANTEFTSTFKVDVTDVSDGITVEIETENSDDTTQDVEISEVKLGIIAGMADGIRNVAPADLSGTNFWTASIPGVRAYRNGYAVSLVTESANTSNIFLRINGLSYRSLRDAKGVVIPIGAITSGQLIIAVYHSDTNTWRTTFVVPAFHAAANPRIYTEPDDVGGTANAITLTHSPVIATLEAGDVFEFLAEFDSTDAAVTIAVDSIAAVDCKRTDGTDLVSGDIKDGQDIRAFYDGTNFLLNITSTGGAAGTDGADGRFRVILYQNKTGTAPTAPTNITYTFATGALANLGDWSETRTAPGSGETTYEIIDTVDPDTDDASETLSFNTPVALITGGELDPANQRSESIKFQAVTTDVEYGTDATPLTAIATDPIVVEYGSGVAEIITATEAITGGGTAIQIAKAGIYLVTYHAIIQLQESSGRVVPGIDFYEEDDTVGTDPSIGSIEGHYTRNQQVGNHRFEVTARMIVGADNTSIKIVPVSIEQHGTTNTPYQIDVNSILYIERLGGDATGGGTLLTEAQITDEASTTAGLISGQRAKQAVDAFGLKEADIEDFVTEHISHTIRRRLRIGAGVLEHGDVRFDATTIEINVSQDTEDGWFGDLEVGAEIRMHGLTSGARSQYTLDSVSESGDDATITVTRDSHSGIFSHNETVVIVFDQRHAPRSDWTETDENRPAYIKDKPSRKFFYGEGQSDRDDVQQTLGADGTAYPFAFTGDDDETDFSPPFDVAFTDIDDETDADIDKGLSTSDNHVFAPDAGTYDLDFEAIGNQESSGTPAVQLVKIESGTDDRLMLQRPGFSAGTMPEHTTYSLQHKSLRVTSGDKFYLQFIGLGTNYLAAGSLMLEKLS